MTKILDKNVLLKNKVNRILRKGKCKARAYEQSYISFGSHIDMTPFYVFIEVNYHNFPKLMIKKLKRSDYPSRIKYVEARNALKKKREVYNERHVIEARKMLRDANIKYRSFREYGKLKLKLV